jgi:hypothetical protein
VDNGGGAFVVAHSAVALSSDQHLAKSRSDRKHARRLTTLLFCSQAGGALAVRLAIGRLQHMPAAQRNSIFSWDWVAVSLTTLLLLWWYDVLLHGVARVVGLGARWREQIVPLSESKRLWSLELTTRCFMVLNAVFLVIFVRDTGGFLRSPLALLLTAIPVTIVILRNPRKKGVAAVGLQILLILAALSYWGVRRPPVSSAAGSRYDPFADPGFLWAFAIVALFVLLLSVLSLELQKAELADRASNVFFSNASRVSYAARMNQER